MVARERNATRKRPISDNPEATPGGRKTKKFNLNTYKFHAMGDYVRSIRLFGTTDSFTTQIVSECTVFSSQSDFGPGRVGS